MRENLRAPKIIGVLLAAGVGSSALTGCGGEAKQTWEVGVTCPEGGKVEVASLDTDMYIHDENDAQVDVICVNKAGDDIGVTGMELTTGEGAIIDNNKDYTSTINIDYDDQIDGYNPVISMDTFTGYIVTDHVEIGSVAVSE